MTPTKTTPKDFFLHLSATVALYASVIALINLSFSIINYYFPDALASYFYAGSVAWPISILVVLVPILYVIEWFIKKDIRMIPEKADLWIRRWRIYLTLFLTGVIIAGDLITLINTYLNGEISIRFVYKFLVVLVILGIVFSYYLLEKISTSSKRKSFLAYAGIIIVAIAIAGGFMTVGSPSTQRALRFDSQRVNDLSSIQWQVVSYWQRKGQLPVSLKDLYDPISGQVIPTDPENKSEYEYIVKGKQSFELCATFAEKSRDNAGKGAGYSYDIYSPYSGGEKNENWTHDEGRICFERNIDPERYPVNKSFPI